MPDPELYAAVDLGSNSFHMIVARVEHGELRVIDRIKEMVRLAGGLDEQGRIDPDTRQLALACLARFGQRIANIPEHQLRAVGTQTFRRLRNPASLLVVAETALGCPIDIISGREEARLVYTGVSQGIAPSSGRRLVIDIGGGSTEIVAGETLDPILAESLPFGCVGTTRRAFPDGRISEGRWRQGSHEIRGELQAYSAVFKKFGWNQAVGSSGTIRAVLQILTALDASTTGAIQPQGIALIKEHLLTAGHIDQVDLPGLSERRRPVIAGGVMVLEAVMEALDIHALKVSDFALREGLLYDLKGRLEHRDPRDKTVLAMVERYQPDLAQADRISDWVATAFDQVAEDWQLNSVHGDFLHWISQLHEIGLSIAHDGYHQHSAYILAHADMPGFSRHEQQFMATLARLQRRRLETSEIDKLPQRLQQPARHLLALLRLAIALHRARSDAGPFDFSLTARDAHLTLELPRDWLANHPLTRQDLDFETQQLKRLGISLRLAELKQPAAHP